MSQRQTASPEPRVRGLREADVDEVVALSAAAFDIDLTEADAAARWHQRVTYGIGTDPDGAFVAERDGSIVGFAQALMRERLWCLSLLTVRPAAQSAGAGRALMERTLRYGPDGAPGLIVSSDDERALALYARSGFTLMPTVQAAGTVERRALPAPDARVCEDDAPDLERLAAISREIRGAPHTSELAYALGRGARLLRFGDAGFVVAQPGYGIWLLVAREEETASALLWGGLELVAGAAPVRVRWITSEQDWAIDVVKRAGLRVGAHGALCVRGRPGPLWPFIPSAPFA